MIAANKFSIIIIFSIIGKNNGIGQCTNIKRFYCAPAIAQMKINRDANINKDYISSQGNELTYNSNTGLWDIGQSFYFHFSVKLTDSTSTNPEVVLRAAKESDVTYSCDIIDDSVDGGIRKGYINLTAALSDEVGIHVRNRTQDSIIWANNLEAEINACNTIEEVEAVDINFNNIN